MSLKRCENTGNGTAKAQLKLHLALGKRLRIFRVDWRDVNFGDLQKQRQAAIRKPPTKYFMAAFRYLYTKIKDGGRLMAISYSIIEAQLNKFQESQSLQNDE